MVTWDIRPQVFTFSEIPRWYGLIFAAGLLGGYGIVRKIFVKEDKPVELVETLFTYVFLGTLIGMRLGHCLFYQPEIYLSNPLRIFMIWEGGYASHGGFIGIITSLVVFSRKYREINLLWLADRVAIGCMFTAGAIRLGNLFNSEMIGHPTDVPWAFVFPMHDQIPRHPAQLYECLGYFAVCGIFWLIYQTGRMSKTNGVNFGLVMICGFGWRFFCEYFKLNQVAFEQGLPINMGQILSLPFILFGVYLALKMHVKDKPAT